MPRSTKVKWGTDPNVKFGKTDPIDAKGRLTGLFESGQIDVNNWTTKLLNFSFPDLKLTRFPESTIRTHCNKVCSVVVHQRGLDQQARLLGRRSNNNNVDDDELSTVSSGHSEEEEAEAEHTPPRGPTPNRHPTMSASSRASSRRGSRGTGYDDEDDISDLADRLSTVRVALIDNTTTVKIRVDDEDLECSVWQDPVHTACFDHTDPFGETVNVQIIGVETLGGLVATDLKCSFVEKGGRHVVLVKKQSGLGQDPGGMFVGGMSKDTVDELPDAANATLKHKVVRKELYFDRNSSTRTAIDKTNKTAKDRYYLMRIALDIRGDEKGFFPIAYPDGDLPTVPGEGLMTVDHELLKHAADEAAKQEVENTIGKYRMMWFFVVEKGNYKTKSNMAQYKGVSSSPGGAGSMDKAAFAPDEFGSTKKRKQG